MGIVKIPAAETADSDAPAPQSQPADLFHHAVRHTADRIKIPPVLRRHEIAALVMPLPSEAPLKKPGILVGRLAAYRKLLQVIPDRGEGILKIFQFQRPVSLKRLRRLKIGLPIPDGLWREMEISPGKEHREKPPWLISILHERIQCGQCLRGEFHLPEHAAFP